MRIAYHPPSMCSACFGQYPERVHVDFEAAWDGPVVNNNGTAYSVDELVICEDCMRAAYELLPLSEDAETLHDQLAALRAQNAQLVQYSQALEAGVSRLEHAMGVRPENLPSAPAPRRKPARA